MIIDIDNHWYCLKIKIKDNSDITEIGILFEIYNSDSRQITNQKRYN